MRAFPADRTHLELNRNELSQNELISISIQPGRIRKWPDLSAAVASGSSPAVGHPCPQTTESPEEPELLQKEAERGQQEDSAVEDEDAADADHLQLLSLVADGGGAGLTGRGAVRGGPPPALLPNLQHSGFLQLQDSADTRTDRHTNTQTHTLTYARTHLHTCAHTRTHTHTHTHTHKHTHKHTHTHTHIHTYMHTHTHTCLLYTSPSPRDFG